MPGSKKPNYVYYMLICSFVNFFEANVYTLR